MSETTASVYVIAGHMSALRDAIADQFHASGATVVTTDLGSGDIDIWSCGNRASADRIAGYEPALNATIKRQMARLLSRVHHMDGLVNIVGAEPKLGRPPRSTFVDGVNEGDFPLIRELIGAAYVTWMGSHGGSITNVLGVHPHNSQPTESIADALVLALTRELSVELAPHIDVNAVVGEAVAGELRYLVDEDAQSPRIERRDEAADPRAIARAVLELQTAPRGAKNGCIVVFARPDTSGLAQKEPAIYG